jgi:hypothetical protein
MLAYHDIYSVVLSYLCQAFLGLANLIPPYTLRISIDNIMISMSKSPKDLVGHKVAASAPLMLRRAGWLILVRRALSGARSAAHGGREV